MKADEYRYWQGRPVHERMGAVEELIRTHAQPVYPDAIQARCLPPSENNDGGGAYRRVLAGEG